VWILPSRSVGSSSTRSSSPRNGKSITLCHTLIRAGLVDEYRLFVYPVVQGRGRRLFPDGFQVAEAEAARSEGLPKRDHLLGLRPLMTGSAAQPCDPRRSGELVRSASGEQNGIRALRGRSRGEVGEGPAGRRSHVGVPAEDDPGPAPGRPARRPRRVGDLVVGGGGVPVVFWGCRRPGTLAACPGSRGRRNTGLVTGV
jgi:hypothetical protein